MIALFISSAALAETYLIEGMEVEFIEKENLLLKGCVKDCEAIKVIKKHSYISLKEARKGLKYTGSAGSDVCHEVYKASSLLGRETKTKDQKAFCLFADGSMVEINSLTRYLEKKKILR